MSEANQLVEYAPDAMLYYLDNGVPIAIEESNRSGVATISLWVNAGSRHELPYEHGVTHLLEHLLLRRDQAGSDPWQEQVEHYGGVFNGATGRDFLCFYYELLSPYAQEPLPAFIRGLLGHPGNFSPGIVDIEKSIVEEELFRVTDSLEEEMQNRLHSAVFHHELARPAGGTISEVRQLTADKTNNALRTRWNASRISVMVSGLSAEEALPALNDSPLATLHPAPADLGSVIENHPAPDVEVVTDEVETEGVSYLGFGYHGAAVADPKRAAFDVAAALLGGSSASRVSQILREERGLVYAMGAWHTSYQDTGLQTVMLQTSTDKADQVTTILDEIVDDLLAKNPPSSQEIAIARRQVLGRRLMDWQATTERVLAWGTEFLIHGSDGVDLKSWAKSVMAVTPDDVVAALKGWTDRQHIQLAR